MRFELEEPGCSGRLLLDVSSHGVWRGSPLAATCSSPGGGARALARGTAAPLVPPRVRRRRLAMLASVTASARRLPAPRVPSRQAAQLLAGGLAGSVAKTCVAPLERIATMLMADRAGRFSMTQAARAAWREGGAAGLWRGHGATLLKARPAGRAGRRLALEALEAHGAECSPQQRLACRIFPASAINFGVFCGVKDLLLLRKRQGGSSSGSACGSGGGTEAGGAASGGRRAAAAAAPAEELGPAERMLAGAAAGAASSAVTYPLESLRVMMSVAGGMRGSLGACVAQVLRSQGAAGLYRGFRTCVLGDVLGNAIGFSLYEAGIRSAGELAGVGKGSNGGGLVAPSVGLSYGLFDWWLRRLTAAEAAQAQPAARSPSAAPADEAPADEAPADEAP
eukprot:scaffold12.g7914.t1